MTIGQLKEATASRREFATLFLPHIEATLSRFNINTPIRQLCFLAQVGHESGGLFYTEEIASGAAYEGRLDLGNTQAGDGRKFKGRGLIQITGRANYAVLSNDFGIDLVANPVLLGAKNATKCSTEQLQNAALSAGWYWNKRNINAIADQININNSIDSGSNKARFIEITRKINGGTNGLQDRFNRYKAGLPFFIGL